MYVCVQYCIRLTTYGVAYAYASYVVSDCKMQLGMNMKTNRQLFPKKTTITTALFCAFSSSLSSAAPTDANGNPTPTAATTGNGYNHNGYSTNNNPYINSSTNQLLNPLVYDSDTGTFSTENVDKSLNYAGITQAISIVNSSLKLNLNNEGIVILEGNNVSADDATKQLTLNNSGSNQYTILYKNLANFINIYNFNQTTTIMDSNTANDATITNDNANIYLNANSAERANITNTNNGYLYFYNNSAANSIINTTDSTIEFALNKADGIQIDANNSILSFDRNQAQYAVINLSNKTLGAFARNTNIHNLTLTNDNSIAYFFLNDAESSTIKNINGAKFISFGGDNISYSTLYNDATSTMEFYSSDTTDPQYNTTAKNITFDNDGNIYINGIIDFTSSILNNKGNLYFSNQLGHTTVTGGTVNNYGTFSFGDDDTITDMTFNNYGNTIIGNNSSFTGTFTQNGTLILDTTANINAIINADITNNGSIILNPTSHSAGNTLTINGNYLGGGSLSLGTVIGESDSLTDKLVVTGNTSGSTSLYVYNEGGTGTSNASYTKLIEVQGQSNGTFVQAQRILAGAYEYYVEKIGSDWYLTNILPNTNSHVYRPGIGGYIANKMYANTLFNIRYADHNQDHYYKDPITGEIKKTSMWLRQSYANGHFNVGDTSINSHSIYNSTQIGGNFLEGTSNQTNRFIVGAMAGLAYIDGHSVNTTNNNGASHSADGYNIGIYGTWLSNALPNRGAYVDSWLQYNYFRNSVTENSLSADKYTSKGITASVEAGYTFGLGNNCISSCLYLQPQIQATWLGVKMDTHQDMNSGTISDTNNGQWQTRAGARLYLDNDESTLTIKPYIEANYIHTPKNYDINFKGETHGINTLKKLTEIKLGVEGNIKNNLKVWGNVAQQSGDNNYRNRQIMVGINYAY